MEVIQLFEKLLSYKSITPNDDGAFLFIRDYLSDFEAIELNFGEVKNLFLYKKFNNSNRHLCFAGHIDVVPPGEGWNNDPFNPVYKDNYIYARGTQDMKSGVAAILYALKNLKNFNGIVSVLLTSDEEGEAVNGTVKVLEYLKEKNFLPQFVIVAEPTCEKVFGDSIKVGRRGSINGVLKLYGKQGHVAYPQKCINPVDLLAPRLSLISGVNLDDGDEYFAPSKMVITDIRGGLEVTNVTPSLVKIMFNVRNSTKTNITDIKNHIDKVFNGLDYKLDLTQSSYPFITDKNSILVKTMKKAIKNIVGVEAKNSTAGGTSDARFFGKLGIDTVEFGVINDRIHSVNERVSIDEVKNLSKIFDEFLKIF